MIQTSLPFRRLRFERTLVDLLLVFWQRSDLYDDSVQRLAVGLNPRIVMTADGAGLFSVACSLSLSVRSS